MSEKVETEVIAEETQQETAAATNGQTASLEASDAAAEDVAEVQETEASPEAVAPQTESTEAAVAAETVNATAEDAADQATEETPANEKSGDEKSAASTNEQSAATGEEEPQKVVRVLNVGMEVDGVVKRTTDFGAFVDIGVGRDGLIHISELSTRRVAKVTDVVKQGQKITAWIKELDRSRNRISLTLISPDTKTIRDLEKDEIVQGTVTRIVPYGAFIDIGVGRDALLHIREMATGYVNKPEDVVKVGDAVEARIIEISRRRGRIDLSMKGLGAEPEAELAATEAAEEEIEPEDPFEGMEVLSPMELAFQKAMTEGDEEIEGVTRKRSKRARREQMRSLQDEIISRTLKSSGSRS